MPKALKQKQEYGIPLSRYTVFLQNCPLGHDPNGLGFFVIVAKRKGSGFEPNPPLPKVDGGSVRARKKATVWLFLEANNENNESVKPRLAQAQADDYIFGRANVRHRLKSKPHSTIFTFVACGR